MTQERVGFLPSSHRRHYFRINTNAYRSLSLFFRRFWGVLFSGLANSSSLLHICACATAPWAATSHSLSSRWYFARLLVRCEQGLFPDHIEWPMFRVAAWTQVLIEGSSGAHVSVRIPPEGRGQLSIPGVNVCYYLWEKWHKTSRCLLSVDVSLRTFESCRCHGCFLCDARRFPHWTDFKSVHVHRLFLYDVLVSSVRRQHGRIILPGVWLDAGQLLGRTASHINTIVHAWKFMFPSKKSVFPSASRKGHLSYLCPLALRTGSSSSARPN